MMGMVMGGCLAEMHCFKVWQIEEKYIEYIVDYYQG